MGKLDLHLEGRGVGKPRKQHTRPHTCIIICLRFLCPPLDCGCPERGVHASSSYISIVYGKGLKSGVNFPFKCHLFFNWGIIALQCCVDFCCTNVKQPCHAGLGRSVVADSFIRRGLYPTRLLCPWGFSRQEYWSGLPYPPRGIFPAQRLNPGLLHCRWILDCLGHQGSLRILEWGACPFSRGSS